MEIRGKAVWWPGQIIRGLLIGALTGAVISFFSTMIHFCTEINREHPMLILLIPLGAVATYYIYKFFGPTYRNGTVTAIDEVNRFQGPKNLAHSQIPDEISPKMGVVALICTFITHITGASGGKEGTGVQLGIACSSLIERLEIGYYNRRSLSYYDHTDYYIMCGASAAFGALFSAPISGVMFGTQLASPRTTRLDAYLPCAVSSYTAVLVSKALGVHILDIPPFEPLAFNVQNTLIVFVFALLTGLYSRIFCYVLHALKSFFQTRFKTEVMKVFMPGLCLLLASLVTYYFFGTFRYNGLGGNLLHDLILGDASDLDDVLKLIMVALTYASGFAGGEVVPLLIVGAGFGLTFAHIAGVATPAFVALGSVSMLSGGTNLPLVCFTLGIELFSYNEPALLFLSIIIAFVASGRSGIYAHQQQAY